MLSLRDLQLVPDTLFGRDAGVRHIAGASVRGGMHTMIGQGVSFGITLLRTIVLARLLAPADFGIMGMVTVVVHFAQMFSASGLSLATVQAKSLTHEQVSTYFWISALINIGIAVLLVLCSPLVAWVYQTPALEAVTVTLSLSFVFGGFTIQQQALLQRDMRFGALAVTIALGQLCSLIVSAVLALMGWGYWSLVVGSLAYTIVHAILLQVVCPLKPSFRFSRHGLRHALAFGGHVAGFNLLNYAARHADNALIGRYWGASALGIYAKAYALLLLPLSQLREPMNAVLFPALCSIRDDNRRYIKYYTCFVNIMFSLSLPLSLYCLIQADVLIHTLLGPQWLDAVPVFRVLAVASLVQPTLGTTGSVMLSYGYSKRYFKLGVVNGIAVVTAFILGVQHGVQGVAIAYASVTILSFLPMACYCLRATPICIGLFLRAHLGAWLPALFAGLSLLGMRMGFGIHTIYEHALISALFALVYVLLSLRRGSIQEMVCTVMQYRKTSPLPAKGESLCKEVVVESGDVVL